jgi:hypothetical protein
MRALAAYLSGVSDTLAGRASSLSGPVACVKFEGPAATEFRARMRDWQSEAVGEARQLQDLATRLLNAADRVEAEQSLAHRRELEATARAKEHALQP